MGIFGFFTKASNKWTKDELMSLYYYLKTMGLMDGNLSQDEKDVILALISQMGGDKYTKDFQTWSSFIDTAIKMNPEEPPKILESMSKEKKVGVLSCLNAVAYADDKFTKGEKKLYDFLKNDILKVEIDGTVIEEKEGDVMLEGITNKKSTEKSKKRLTYLIPDEKKEGIYTEVESTSEMLGFGDDFYNLSDWEQIKAIIEMIKKSGNDRIFGTWVAYEFRYMEYSFEDKFKVKFIKKAISYYRDELTINQLEEYFNNNVPWKE